MGSVGVLPPSGACSASDMKKFLCGAAFPCAIPLFQLNGAEGRMADFGAGPAAHRAYSTPSRVEKKLWSRPGVFRIPSFAASD